MPSRNVIKPDVETSYYHVYARGASKRTIFLEEDDFRYFENLFVRYLSDKPVVGKKGFVYPHYSGNIELLAYCLMGNHFHLLLYQSKATMMSKLLRSCMTSYSRYFNLKYKNSGPLFESRYKASLITSESYLEHVSRYIHLNPRYWMHYRHSSLRYYRDSEPPEWLKPRKIATLFEGPKEYLDFVADYEASQRMLEEIKHNLADT